MAIQQKPRGVVFPDALLPPTFYTPTPIPGSPVLLKEKLNRRAFAKQPFLPSFSSRANLDLLAQASNPTRFNNLSSTLINVVRFNI